MELLDDAEIRSEADELRERARNGEPLDDLLPEAFALCREAARRHHRPAPLRRAADRRHGAARRRDRRDEDRRGQDPHRDPAGVPQLARRHARPPGHRQRLPGPPRRRVDGPDLRRAGGQRRRDPGADDPAVRQRAYACDVVYGTNSEFGFDYLRDNMASSLETLRPARARVRDRRRGRQHPDRRGAHAADHLRRTRGGRRPVLHVRPPRQAADRGAVEEEAEVARRGPRTRPRPTTTTSTTRSTRPSPRPSRGWPRRSGSWASTTSTCPSTAPWSTT